MDSVVPGMSPQTHSLLFPCFAQCQISCPHCISCLPARFDQWKVLEGRSKGKAEVFLLLPLSQTASLAATYRTKLSASARTATPDLLHFCLLLLLFLSSWGVIDLLLLVILGCHTGPCWLFHIHITCATNSRCEIPRFTPCGVSFPRWTWTDILD